MRSCHGLKLYGPIVCSMAHFLRGKQAGIQTDLSAGLAPELFAIDDVPLPKLLDLNSLTT